MTLATKKRRFWSCPKCAHRNEATRSRKCQNPECGALSRPKKRVPKHAEVLRDTPYERWERISYEIHGRAVELGACGVCGRLPGESRPRHDRDHDHRTGKARGLACVRCNRELLRNTTLEEARAVVAYLERVERWYAGHVDAG